MRLLRIVCYCFIFMFSIILGFWSVVGSCMDEEESPRQGKEGNQAAVIAHLCPCPQLKNNTSNSSTEKVSLELPHSVLLIGTLPFLTRSRSSFLFPVKVITTSKGLWRNTLGYIEKKTHLIILKYISFQCSHTSGKQSLQEQVLSNLS